MALLLLIGSFQATFFATLLLTKGHKKLHDKVLLSWLLVIAFQLFTIYGAFQQLFLKTPQLLLLAPLAESLIYFHGPALLLYTQLLIAKEPVLKKVQLAHFLLFLASILFLILLFLVHEQDLWIFTHLPTVAPNYYAISRFLNHVHGPFYIVWVFFLLNKHSRDVKNNFSFTEYVNLAWLKHITIAFSLIWIAVLVTILFDLPFKGDEVIYATATFVVFLLGFLGLKQGNVFHEEATVVLRSNIQEPKYEKSNIDESVAKKIAGDLRAHMQEKQAFLKSRLTLDEVANQLDTTTHILSQVLNQHMGKTFFDFVNEYRVEKAQKMLLDRDFDHYTLLGIALDAGFNSKSSFNRIFKKHVGCPPSEFKSRNRN